MESESPSAFDLQAEPKEACNLKESKIVNSIGFADGSHVDSVPTDKLLL